ncbi:hypothetical protein [Candidatus Methanocrinis natronophilus]|uniref:Secreted protein n=1 Tax=Candidatus Methanocrinis natronophilus TaxID=3033396 RepID=A0ABT5X9Y9_9EURY|nr:hypothetical protein [Candidatus Methanocrinis natronophilus]MDF0591526.1 hypothetical protein [Candidatus Methanocrinis natronophilus]
MKLKKALMVPLIFLAAIASPAASEDLNLDDLSGSQIRSDVGEAFRGESLFYIDPATGMRPGVPNASGVYTPPTTTGSPWSNVAGRWTLNLVDRSRWTLDLTLYQHGNEVFGRGVMTSGVITQVVTAAGSTTEGSALNLRLVTVGGDNMYRLQTGVIGDKISGPYTVYTSTGDFWAGYCDGSRFYSAAILVPAEGSRPIGLGRIGMGISGGNAMV